MGNIPSRSPYTGQFITLYFDQSWPFGPDPGQASEKTQAVVIHFLFIHPLFSYAVVRTLKRGYRRSKLVFFTEASSSPWSHPHRLAHSGLLRPDSRLRDCPRHSDVGHGSSVALQPVSSPCSQYRHVAVSPLALLPAVSQPCSRSRRLTVSIITLLSASSTCC